VGSARQYKASNATTMLPITTLSKCSCSQNDGAGEVAGWRERSRPQAVATLEKTGRVVHSNSRVRASKRTLSKVCPLLDTSRPDVRKVRMREHHE
jgi:hypothetical protein